MRHLLTSLLLILCVTIHAGEPAPSDTAYRFAGGEKIKLIVPPTIGETIEQLVSEDGFVSLPIGGMVNIKAKTLLEAQASIAEVLTKEAGARRVYAAIALLEVAQRKVYITGDVKTPSSINLPTGSSLTLAAALASVGGPTAEADLSRVRLVRASGKEVLTYDASQIGQSQNGDLGPILQPGDVVTVPRGDVFILAGEVSKPGAYSRKELAFGPREPAWLSRVLYAGGGLKPTANRRAIRIIRTQTSGAKEVLSVNLDHAIRSQDGSGTPDSRNDPALMNGDVIIADAVGGASILGKVKQPGVYPVGGESIKLTKLIAMAGGFTEFAKTSSVTVIRASAPKSPIRVDVGNITKSGDLDKDVDLQDGDLVFVGERML